jgi:NADPH:quinone reductase-like Zn-dependent oxidoreductase
VRAAVAVAQDAANPLAGLVLRDVPMPDPRPGWALVRVVASSLNMHDLWTLRGVGHSPEDLPRILGCDAAGYDVDGNPVVVYPVIGSADRGNGDETLDPQRALLSEKHDGAFAEWLLVPERNLLPKPPDLSFDEAACLPVAWGTAYRMLFTHGQLRAGDRVLVQGAAGGVASAAIKLAVAAGAVVYATSRSAAKLELAESWGARGIGSGGRLPELVDLVVETVGEATWSHSMKCLRPGGTIVIAGATSGTNPPADLGRIFYRQQRVIGSTGCTRTEFASLLRMTATTAARPVIDRAMPLEEIHKGFQLMADGDLAGKVVIHPTDPEERT